MIVLSAFVIAVLAFCVSAVAGGGAGLVLVPLLRLLLPMAEVPGALSIGTATGSLARVHAFRAHIRWDVVRWFVPAALPMAGLGAWALSRFQPAYVELLIGIFLLANLPAVFRRASTFPTARPMAKPLLVLLGGAAGLISGFTGAVGLLFNRAYLRMGMSKPELVATRAANEITIHLLKIVLYAVFGLLTRSALFVGVLVAVAAVLAAYIMRWLLPRVNEALFRRVSDVAMVAAGAAMFLTSSGEIMALHRAWASIVRVGTDHEVRFYWAAEHRFVFEWGNDGSPAIERRIDPKDLSPPQRAVAQALARRGRIVLLEEVIGWRGRYVEIYVQDASGLRKVEVP